MKKMIALLLAMLMALGCLQAMAEEPAAEEAPAETVTAEAPKAASTLKMELAIDKEKIKNMVMASGDMQGSENLVDSILDLVDALEITTVTDNDGAQIDLGLNGKTAVSIGLGEKDGGLIIASTLFPNYMITVPQETLQSMVPQMQPATTGTANGANTSISFQPTSKGINAIVDAIRKINPELIFSVIATKEGILIQFEQGEQYYAFSMVPEEDNVLGLYAYVTDKENPVAGLMASSAEGGERTLSLDPEGKTVLSVADLQGPDAAKAMEGLQTDLQTGIMQMMAVPEIANVMAAYTMMMQQTMQQETGEPAAEEAVPAGNP